MEAACMGTTAHVVVTGRPDLERQALDRLAELEARWSRFLPDSEITAVNDAGGRAVPVTADTFDVLRAARRAWARTGGLFDPTVHAAIVGLGYDRTFSAVAEVGSVARTQPAPGCGGVVLDAGDVERRSTVRLPAGVAIDLGGIAKGHAADLVLAELLDAGAAGACVNVGGDLALAGEAPTEDGWIVGVDDPFVRGREILRLALAGGAVATTSRLRRRWRRGGVEVHHVLDPRTGRPARTDVAAVTVIAGRAADAEVLAKLPFLDMALAEALVHEEGASAIVIDDRRGVRCLGAIERFAA